MIFWFPIRVLRSKILAPASHLGVEILDAANHLLLELWDRGHCHSSLNAFILVSRLGS